MPSEYNVNRIAQHACGNQPLQSHVIGWILLRHQRGQRRGGNAGAKTGPIFFPACPGPTTREWNQAQFPVKLEVVRSRDLQGRFNPNQQAWLGHQLFSDVGPPARNDVGIAALSLAYSGNLVACGTAMRLKCVCKQIDRQNNLNFLAY